MISIVIPVLNEASTIEATLKRIMCLKGDYEVIVVDGGSSDKTVCLASNYATVIQTKKGRGNQLNVGASHAQGEIIWFIHSDSRIASNSIIIIEKACGMGNVGGCFSLDFYDVDSFNMKCLAWTSNLRAKHLKLMYGDQGIFVKKEMFDDLQGFENIPIMEDWNFSRRLAKQGRICVLKDGIGTSGRRFIEGGFYNTLLKMHWIKWKYVTGTSPEVLIKYYKEIR